MPVGEVEDDQRPEAWRQQFQPVGGQARPGTADEAAVGDAHQPARAAAGRRPHTGRPQAGRAGGREDRAAREREERKVLEASVPAGLAADELFALIEEAVASTGASGPGDLGKVMGYVMAKARGRVDGRAVQDLVRERLG